MDEAADEPADVAASAADREAVARVASDYIEGWYAGDADRMERSLRDDLVKRTPVADERGSAAVLRAVTKERMVELTRDGGGRGVAEPAIAVFVDDVSGDIAAARTVCTDFVDYLQLVRTPAGWQIANILFRTIG